QTPQGRWIRWCSKRDSNRWSPPTGTIHDDPDRPPAHLIGEKTRRPRGEGPRVRIRLLLRGVWREYDIRERIPSLTGKDFANAAAYQAAEHQRAQDRAPQVEAVAARLGVRQQAHRQHQGDDADRHVDREQPRPRGDPEDR